MKSSTFELDLRQIIIIIIYSGYPLFSVGPAKIMYNTVTIQCDTIPPNTIRYEYLKHTGSMTICTYRLHILYIFYSFINIISLMLASLPRKAIRSSLRQRVQRPHSDFHRKKHRQRFSLHFPRTSTSRAAALREKDHW